LKKSKLWRTLILIDQLFAVWIFNAHEDQTISGHVGFKAHTLKTRKYLLMERFINFLFSRWEKDHCFNAIEWDRVDERK
jgi:hypothetical protein